MVYLDYTFTKMNVHDGIFMLPLLLRTFDATDMKFAE